MSACYPILEIDTDAYDRAPSEGLPLHASTANAPSPRQIQMEASQPKEVIVPQQPRSVEISSNANNHASTHSNTSPYTQEPGGGSLAPAGVLSQEAMTGDFSLVNVFRVPGVTLENEKIEANVPKKSVSELRSDPTVLGIVSMPVARNLFDS